MSPSPLPTNLGCQRALRFARIAALRCAAKAVDPETDPETAVSLCRASGKYAGKVRQLQAPGGASMTEITKSPPPRWKASSIGETAKAAALHMKPRAPSLRQRVLDLIEAEPATPEALHAKLRSQGVATVLTAVRPRCSELARMGLIADSGQRALAESGRCKAIVWRATDPAERAQWAARQAMETADE